MYAAQRLSMSSIWSIPVFVFLSAGLFILLLNRKNTNIGASWFAAIIAGIFAWGWTISLYFRPDIQIVPLSEIVQIYSSKSPLSVSLTDIFVLDGISFPYMLSMSALLVIMLLSAPSNMDSQTAPRLCFFYLLLTAIGYLSVSANDVRFIIYGWVIFDSIDLVAHYLQARPGKIHRSILLAVGVRFIGTLLAASSLALSISESPEDFSSFISIKGGAYLFTACALRMGILPMTQPYSEPSNSRVGLGTTLRLVSILTVMPVLSRLPLSGLRPDLIIFLKLSSILASLTGAVGWLLSENSITGNTFASMALCGMTFACALNQNQEALIVWGISVVLFCAPLSLYQFHNTFMNILTVLLVILFSGLPYTPNAFGWNGLINETFPGFSIVFVLIMAFLLGGAFLHIFRFKGKSFSELEPWMRSVYPIGFITAIVTHIFIGMTNFNSRFTLGNIQASVTAFILGIILTLSIRYMPEIRRTQNTAVWGRTLISIFWTGMQKLLDMDWLLALGNIIWKVVKWIFSTLSLVLENNGGLIWELLLMVLLIAVAFSGGFF